MCPNISPVSLVWWLLEIGIQPNTLSSSSMTPIQLWYYTWAGWTGACCISVFLVRYKYCICVHYGNMSRYVRENTTTTTVLSVFPHRHNRHDEYCGRGGPTHCWVYVFVLLRFGALPTHTQPCIFLQISYTQSTVLLSKRKNSIYEYVLYSTVRHGLFHLWKIIPPILSN
jgi:hypothetical protein